MFGPECPHTSDIREVPTAHQDNATFKQEHDTTDKNWTMECCIFSAERKSRWKGTQYELKKDEPWNKARTSRLVIGKKVSTFQTLTFLPAKYGFPFIFLGLFSSFRTFSPSFFAHTQSTWRYKTIHGASSSSSILLPSSTNSRFGWKRTSYTPKRLRWCCSHLASGPWSFLNWTPHPSATRRPSSWCFRYSSRSYLVKPHFFETKICE